jgi:hypothetical protein
VAAVAPHAAVQEAEAAAAAPVSFVLQEYQAVCGVGSLLQVLVQLTHLELESQPLLQDSAACSICSFWNSSRALDQTHAAVS